MLLLTTHVPADTVVTSAYLTGDVDTYLGPSGARARDPNSDGSAQQVRFTIISAEAVDRLALRNLVSINSGQLHHPPVTPADRPLNMPCL